MHGEAFVGQRISAVKQPDGENLLAIWTGTLSEHFSG